eukprot:TRINITY_DN1402_c0_g2_i1.p1 TRINITY_DN1402_c0_g2~~TRINITY_DN1402_c0_g2_i1.p1  ORF type:complete len:208 (+),score=62.45 TRINITY_DN1402_c0_g2_i1:91-714(+)
MQKKQQVEEEDNRSGNYHHSTNEHNDNNTSTTREGVSKSQRSDEKNNTIATTTSTSTSTNNSSKGTKRDLLFLDPSSSSSSSPFLIHSQTTSTTTPKTKPNITKLPKSDLLSRVQSFLPVIEKANKDLDSEIQSGKDVNIESVDESSPYIQMSLGLGVLEEKRKGDEDIKMTVGESGKKAGIVDLSNKNEDENFSDDRESSDNDSDD